MHQHISQTCKYAVDTVQQRCHKQEGKLQRLCDTCQHGSQCCGKEQTADRFSFFRFRCAVHCQCGSRKTKDHQREFTGHKSGCGYCKMFYCRIRQLCKENILCAFDEFSTDFQCSAHTCLPERQIKYVMQTKRKQ